MYLETVSFYKHTKEFMIAILILNQGLVITETKTRENKSHHQRQLNGQCTAIQSPQLPVSIFQQTDISQMSTMSQTTLPGSHFLLFPPPDLIPRNDSHGL